MIVHRNCGGLVTSKEIRWDNLEKPSTLVCLTCETVITDYILEGTELTSSIEFIPPTFHKE